ncbi:hypothetical protein BJV78DRAFT_1289899 [Lactifluus subvellereus]|nr:hypothetical protein BJV78DRAFT_1289899 [Lactifluus subvellereus]
MVEAELRKGQVTDALEGLRLALGEKSLCFRTEVRNVDSQRTPLELGTMFISWMLRLESVGHISTCSSALQHLPTDPEYLATLQEITDEDLKLAGDITNERRFRQRSDALPGFGALEISILQMVHECRNSIE